MDIKSNLSLDAVARAPMAQFHARRPLSPDSAPALTAFEGVESLEAELARIPNIRAEKVEEARPLVKDPAYPPKETLHRLAVLFAMEARPAPPPEQG